ncbi:MULTISPECIES: class I SAM-dependent methyltransferase [Prochlorococcus]|uniref:class I SAM-dependent methyltransferase n=1 Tax=Prochlorococcus TaxID=1218 RepID=UPI0007BC5C48|nr:class I SAM-dependent methyltransferase [Prochlorococcus marinus]KZR84894.1 TPR repeat-containing protein YrrB [Prochlorococcus marinus str. MIT 1327]
MEDLRTIKQLSADGHHQECIQACQEAFQVESEQAIAYKYAGKSFLALGQIEEAKKLLLKAHQLDQSDPETAKDIGNCFNAAQEYAKAINAYKHALSIDPNYAPALNNLGLIAQKQGRHQEAVSLVKKATEINPDFALYYRNLGSIHKDLGNLDQALEATLKSLEIKPDNADAYMNMGVIYKELSKLDKALEATLKSLEIKPDNADAYMNMGIIYKELGRLDKALETTLKSLEIKPDNADAYINTGIIYKELGKLDKALEATINSLAIKPETPAAMNNLKALIKEASLSKSNKHILTKAYELLLNDENTSHRTLAKIFLQAFLPIFKAASNSEPIISKNNKALNQLASDWRLNKSLTLLIPPHPDIEHFLTRFRRELLILASKKQAIPDHLKPLSEALATQCFLNEYAYVQSSDEEKYVQELINMAHNSKEELNQYLAIIACYIPIYILDLKQEWLNSYPTMSEQSKALIKTQLDEPLQEESLKKSLGDSSAISDAVSVDVKAMYEQSPYPRYRFSNFTSQDTSLNISTFIRIESTKKDLPFMEELTINIAHPKVLIAGCGTGNQVIMASRYKNADITAFDLSKTSLAYAIRKADDYQMKNVTFKIMDILDIAAQTEKFDVIECSGVLHHMQDPEEGLSALVHQLKPGGFMKLGLYSELARQQIIEARNQIKQLDIKSTPEGIRDFRSRVLNGDLDQLKGLSKLGDNFYSLSECRDLCFHVQEHRFTTESLGKLLNTHGLIFCGFMLPNSIYKTYKDQFPDDTDMTSLKDWGRFEKLHPMTFRGMYQFWVYKPG